MLLRDLDFFILVADTGSFRGAAVQADVTQPAVTKGIRRLESELGLKLLQRSSQGTSLSEAGALFLKRARRLRNDLNDALREASDMRSRALGVLRVGVAPTLVESFFRRPGAMLLSQRPAARFSLQVALTDQLFSGLRRSELDIVVSAIPDPVDAVFKVHPIGHSRLQVVACRSHPALSAPKLSLQKLVSYQWILPRRGVLSRDWVDGVFARHGLPLPIARIELDTHTDALLPMIVGTDLLSISSDSPGHNALAALAAIPLDELALRRHIGALTRAGSPLSPLAQHFFEVLLQQHGELVLQTDVHAALQVHDVVSGLSAGSIRLPAGDAPRLK